MYRVYRGVKKIIKKGFTFFSASNPENDIFWLANHVVQISGTSNNADITHISAYLFFFFDKFTGTLSCFHVHQELVIFRSKT